MVGRHVRTCQWERDHQPYRHGRRPDADGHGRDAGGGHRPLAGTTAYPGHDRSRVFTDVAVTIADGGTRLGDTAMLADQTDLFGPVASTATTWRVLREATDRGDALATARATVRAHVWGQITARHGAIPPSTIAGSDLPGFVVPRVDTTIMIAHSDKEDAAGTFTKTYGHHLMTV
ncbi:hypothetical protein [Frankia sp. CiP3]|uniref:hypothetical protein n=1 Tax=Frankia sp. CiP3 TaxID=2880971 RepID=UPI001EF4FB12|nr:hypothetical protein [Frankia sp. CiP3]